MKNKLIESYPASSHFTLDHPFYDLKQMSGIREGQAIQFLVACQLLQFILLEALGPKVLAIRQELEEYLVVLLHSSLQDPCDEAIEGISELS